MFGLVLEPDEKQILPYCGMPVLVLMKDGSRKIGQLTSCSSGRLVLNGDAPGGEEAVVSRKAGVRRAARRRPRAQTDDRWGAAPPPPEGWDGLSIPPLGPEPQIPFAVRESVPLKAVESIMIL
jgi:hypothetical protein